MIRAFSQSICEKSTNGYSHSFSNIQELHYTIKHNDMMMNDVTQDNIFKPTHQRASNNFECVAIDSEKIPLN